MGERPRLLVISEEHDVCLKIANIPELEQFDLEFSRSAPNGLERLQRDIYDLVIADLQTPLVDSRDFKQSARLRNHKQPLLFISRLTDIGHNAPDRISRTFSPSDLIRQIANTLELHRSPLEDLHIHTRPDSEAAEGFGLLTGISQEMHDIYQSIRELAPDDTPVLVTGERGTGKALAAQMLHHESQRRKRPFIAVDCNTLQAHQFDAEVSIAFSDICKGTISSASGLCTLADGGTLFLREVSNLDQDAQAKVVSILCSQPNFRLIASTSRNLAQMTAAGVFSQALFNALGKVSIAIPPLRDRSGDIPLLAWYVIRNHGNALGKEISGISSRAMRMLHCYQFPGNVREFTLVMRRAVELAGNRLITVKDLMLEGRLSREPLAAPARSSLRSQVGRHLKGQPLDDFIQTDDSFSPRYNLAGRTESYWASCRSEELCNTFQATAGNFGTPSSPHAA